MKYSVIIYLRCDAGVFDDDDERRKYSEKVAGLISVLPDVVDSHYNFDGKDDKKADKVMRAKIEFLVKSPYHLAMILMTVHTFCETHYFEYKDVEINMIGTSYGWNREFS